MVFTTTKSGLLPLTIDHVYVWVSKDAPEMEALQRIGLRPYGHTTVHEGQGTASRVVLFKNMYLELIWIESEQELATYNQGRAIPLTPPSLIQGNGSPFGVGLHYHTDEMGIPPPTTIVDQASWMPAGSSIQRLPRSSYHMPPLFILQGSLAYRDVPESLTIHDLDIHHLTGVTITVTVLEFGDQHSQQLLESGVVVFQQGDTPLMELVFDDHCQKQSVDLRPTLPLIIHY